VNAIVSIAVYLAVLLPHAEQGVIVDGPLRLEALPALSQADPQRLARARAIWVWSPVAEPRRLSARELREAGRRDLVADHSILVRVPAARGTKAGGLRLIAGPVEMWDEVPEAMLPSWRVPASGRVRIPADRVRAWRLRIAGEKAGSLWTELAPGAISALVDVVPAAGARFVVSAGDDQTVRETSVRVLEDVPGPHGSSRALAVFLGDEAGHFAIAGLPDQAPLRWLAAGVGHPATLVVTTPSRLSRIILDSGATIRGRVVDPGGRPLEGALVQVASWGWNGSPMPLVETETKGDGRFAVIAVRFGQVMLMARHHGPARRRLAVKVDRLDVDVGTLALSPDDSLVVSVANDLGEPIVGAQVRADDIDSKIEAATGPDGRAVLHGLSEGSEITIETTAGGHLRADTDVVLPARGLSVRLQRALTVRGRFLGGDGSPLMGASVIVDQGSLDSLEADGSFSLALQPTQDHTLAFRSPHSASLTVAVPAGEPTEERDLGDLLAPTSGTVSGRVISALDGKPVVGARVYYKASNGTDVIATDSGADGVFRFEGVPMGAWFVQINHYGFASAGRAVDVRDGGDVALGDVMLASGTTLVVTGLPETPGAWVNVFLHGEHELGAFFKGPVDAGVARIEHLAPGRARMFVSSAAGTFCRTEIEIRAADDEVHMDCAAIGAP